MLLQQRQLEGLGVEAAACGANQGTRGCAYCNILMELYVMVCVTLSVCTPAAYRLCGVRGRPSLVWGRAARAVHGCGCGADQYITCEHGAPPSCALSVHTSESTASAAQLALPPATAAHGLTATLAWQRVAELHV